jgi:hypothetical protein
LPLDTGFDALFIVTAALAGVALARLRPAAFILLFNQLVTLRALANIAAFGQPEQQSFLPRSIFSPQALAIAWNIFALATLILAVVVLLPARRRTTGPMPALPRWLIWSLSLYFLAVVLSSRTILTHAYTDPERSVFNLNLSGIHALLVGLVLYEVYRRTRAGLLRPVTALGFLVMLFVATDYLKGSTGFPTGALIGIGFMLIAIDGTSRFRQLAKVGAMLLALGSLAVAVRSVRAVLHDEGGDALRSVLVETPRLEQSRSRQGEGAEMLANGTQYAAHVLECIELYEAGLSREWKSIYRPLEYTFKPSAIINALGLTRSEEAAWELARYFIHGGGIYVLGELYWNGGYLCVLLVFLGIAWWSFLCDTRADSSFFWCACACFFYVGLLQGMGYGFAQVSRGILNGLMGYALIRWLPGRRAAA